MENLEGLFKDAERIKLPAGMWRSIAAKVSMPSAIDSRTRGFGLRLAASMVLGLGAMTAMLLVIKDPKRTMATDAWPRGNAGRASQVQEEGALVDSDILAWHADLGEESAMEWESEIGLLLSEPATEE